MSILIKRVCKYEFVFRNKKYPDHSYREDAETFDGVAYGVAHFFTVWKYGGWINYGTSYFHQKRPLPQYLGITPEMDEEKQGLILSRYMHRVIGRLKGFILKELEENKGVIDGS